MGHASNPTWCKYALTVNVNVLPSDGHLLPFVGSRPKLPLFEHFRMVNRARNHSVLRPSLQSVANDLQLPGGWMGFQLKWLLPGWTWPGGCKPQALPGCTMAASWGLLNFAATYRHSTPGGGEVSGESFKRAVAHIFSLYP